MSALRDDHHLQPKAWTPWNGVPIASRTVQPFGVQIQTATEVAPVSDISPSETGAFVIPFLPFEITPIGLVAVSDAHRGNERKSAWATENFSLRSGK